MTEGIYLVPILVKLKEVSCSCHCGHDIALVCENDGVQHMVGCKECSTAEDIHRVLAKLLIDKFNETKAHPNL